MKKIFLLVLFISFNLLNAQVELKWAGAFQSNNTAVGRSVVADKFGNVYSTGYYNGTIDLDPGTGVSSFTTGANQSFFVTKMDLNGNLIWAKNFTGQVHVWSQSIGLDSLGNVVTMGFFESNILNNPIDFDPGPGVQNLAALGSTDAFILKLDPNGNFMWVRQVGGVSASVNPTSMDIDKHGNVHVVGSFSGTADFNPGVAVNTISSSGNSNGFIFKLDTYGNYIWAGAFISSMSANPNEIKVDNNGNMLLVGHASGSVDFDTGPSTNTVWLGTGGGGIDNGFICKLDALGNLIWVKISTNSSGGQVIYNSISSDSNGDCYITGEFFSTYDFDPGPGTFYLSSTPGYYSYILKLSSNGNFLWANSFQYHVGLDITSDIYDNIYFTGNQGSYSPTFVVKINTSGNVIWKEESGSTNGSSIYGYSNLIFVDTLQNVYLTGEFYSGPFDFDPNPGVYNLTTSSQSTSSQSIFIQKLGSCTSQPPSSPTDITPIANKSICANATTTLTVANNNLFINWYSSPTSTVVLSTDTFYVPPVLPIGTYTYYPESKDCLYSTARTPITFTVNAPPVISAPNGTVCPNQAFTITPTGAVTYSYSSLNPVVYPPSTNTYTVTGFSSAGCSAVTTLTVYTLPLPNVTSNGSGAICTGNSFTINASGAVTYTYASATSTVTSTSNTIVVSPTTTTQYTVFGASSAGCVKYTDFNVFVDQYPSLVTSQSQSVICIGTSDTLRASGATNHIWNGSTNTTSIVVSPTVTTNYTVVGLTGMGLCLTTHTLTVVVNQNCQDVWPGDANSDGTANNLDVLELGLHYTQTGTPRASTSNTWQSYFATNWTGSITNGKNLNHSDCNGDGAINDNDTLAIFNNYGLTHTFKQEEINSVNPQLRIVPDQAYVTKGNWGTASIFLGDATANINNINGVAFTIGFNNTLIEPSNIWLEYLPSFIDASQNLHFRKLDFANGKIFTTTTHTVNNNVSGNGLIAKLHYQIKSNLTTDDVLSIGLSLANKSNATGVITPLTTGTGTLMAIGASVGLQELNGNMISVSPNPSNGSLTIQSKTELQKIEVMSIDGKILLSEIPTNVSHTLHLDNFANGIYFVNLYQNNRVVMREKVILNK